MTDAVTTEAGGKNTDAGKQPDGGTEPSEGFEKFDQISLETIKVVNANNFPIDIDMVAEYQNIFAAGILRNVDYINAYDTICETLFSGRGVKLGQLLFWMVFCTKFQPESTFLPQLRQKISKLYSKIFTKLPQPKDSLTNLLVYLIAYAVHVTFWDVFTEKDRTLFNMRFILDCYHIVLFELHGVFVSDQTIQNTIEKLFGAKFFFYEKKNEKQKKKPEIKDRKDQPLLRDLDFNPDSLLSVQGGVEFAAELSSKLRDQTRHDFSPPERSRMRKSAFTNGDTSVILKKGSESKPRSSVDTQDTTNNDILNQSENKKVYFPKIKFDCHQVSPTVLRFLNTTAGRSMSQKKKLTIHADSKHLTAMRNYKVSESIDNILAVPPVIHEKKKRAKDNIMRDYNIKHRPEDYYLGYLPQKLKDRFKEELDLKYVLDQVGTYSLRSAKLELEEKFKARELEKVERFTEKFLHPTMNRYASQGSQLGMPSTFSPHREGEITEPEAKSIDLDSQDVGTVKKNLNTHFRFESPTHDHRKKEDFINESKHLETSKLALGQDHSASNLFKHVELEDGGSPLSGHSLLKKFNKSQKKNPLLPLLKASSSMLVEPVHIKDIGNKTVEPIVPERKMRIQNINLERNARRKADLYDYEEEQAIKRSENFKYEDNRKKYYKEHGKYVHRSVDANINDLVHRVLQTKVTAGRKSLSIQKQRA